MAGQAFPALLITPEYDGQFPPAVVTFLAANNALTIDLVTTSAAATVIW